MSYSDDDRLADQRGQLTNPLPEQDARGMDNQGERIKALEAEQALLAQALWDAWAALGSDTDGDSGPGARIAGMGLEPWARSVVEDVKQAMVDNDSDWNQEFARAEVAQVVVGQVQALVDRQISKALAEGYTQKGLDNVLMPLRELRAVLPAPVDGEQS